MLLFENLNIITILLFIIFLATLPLADELDEMLEMCQANLDVTSKNIELDSSALELRKCLIREARQVLTCNQGSEDEEVCLGSAEAALTRTRNRGWPGGMSFLTPLPSFMDIACQGAFPVRCNASAQFRSITGICNNLDHQLWGAASTKVRRFIPANYADGKDIPRGGWESSFNHCVTGRLGGGDQVRRNGCKSNPKNLLPNPRYLSYKMMAYSNSRGQHGGNTDHETTHLFVQFGQYITHDISLFPEEEMERNCCEAPDQDGCFPIQIPCDDPHFLSEEFKPRKVNFDEFYNRNNNRNRKLKEDDDFPSYLEGVSKDSLKRMIIRDPRLNASLNLSRNRYIKLNFGPSRTDHFGYRSSFLTDPHRDFGYKERSYRNFPGGTRFELGEDDFGGFNHQPTSARFDPKLGSFAPTLTRGVAMAKAAGMVPEDARIMPAQLAMTNMKPARSPNERGLVDPGYCLEFSRSIAFCEERMVKRDQLNGNTAFIDNSNIYGNEFGVYKKLRLFRHGLMKASQQGQSLPLQGNRCVSGDTRAAEMPSLASFHTLFLREHNRLALEISKVCCDGDDNLIFQRARRIAIAEFQNIVYSEYLPKLLGFRTIYQYRLEVDQRSVYDPTVNPTIRNAFSTAAFRFGHTMVWNNVTLVNSQGDWFREYHIRDRYFQDDIPMSMDGRGVDFIMNGMAVQPGGAVDLSVVEDLTNYLFINSSGVTGADLIARNLQRGRDHGLPPYNEYRKYCGLPPACAWEMKPPEISFERWDLLQDIYDSPQDIDLYIGGLAEEPSQESMLGKTFTCLIAKQFHNLKFGDRFFYTHLSPQPEVIFPFTDDQVFNIRSRTMRDIICDNTELPNFPEYAFRLNSRIKSCSERMPLNMDLFSDAYENQATFNAVPW